MKPIYKISLIVLGSIVVLLFVFLYPFYTITDQVGGGGVSLSHNVTTKTNLWNIIMAKNKPTAQSNWSSLLVE